MTEGPLAKYKAHKVYSEVGGKRLIDIFVRSKRVYIDPEKLIGEVFSRVETFGKNIVFVFNRYAIRIHLMMYGTIHIYSINEPLAKPEEQLRLLLEFEDKKVAVYNAPIVELDTLKNTLKRLRKIVGEDPLRDDWNKERAIRLILKNREKKIGEVLLDQRVLAGIGNILRNEILFRARIHPERLVKDLSKEEVERIVDIAKQLSEEFYKRRLKGERIGPILLVYNKSKKPCPICKKPIRYYIQSPINRRTFVCENCQK